MAPVGIDHNFMMTVISWLYDTNTQCTFHHVCHNTKQTVESMKTNQGLRELTRAGSWQLEDDREREEYIHKQQHAARQLP